ncbi:MAG: hypothetical protein WCR86_11595 [Parabacteroides sp.]
MKYIITTLSKATDIGINPIGHLKKGENIILNEKELMSNALLVGDLTERVKKLGAKSYTDLYIKRLIKTEGYGI